MLYLSLHETVRDRLAAPRHGCLDVQRRRFSRLLKGARPGSPWTMLNKVKEHWSYVFHPPRSSPAGPRLSVSFRTGMSRLSRPPEPQRIRHCRSDRRVDADPPQGSQPVRHQNQHETRGRCKKLARQVKVWKYTRNVPVSSCYLEMRTAKHMEGESAYPALWDLYLTLRKMQDVELAAMNDPTGLGSRFGACSSESNRDDALSKLQSRHPSPQGKGLRQGRRKH